MPRPITASGSEPSRRSSSAKAARALAGLIRAVAGALLETPAADVELRDARASVRGSADRGVLFRELASTVHFRSSELPGVEPSLEATVQGVMLTDQPLTSERVWRALRRAPDASSRA